jgi:hypothetical protein
VIGESLVICEYRFLIYSRFEYAQISNQSRIVNRQRFTNHQSLNHRLFDYRAEQGVGAHPVWLGSFLNCTVLMKG